MSAGNDKPDTRTDCEGEVIRPRVPVTKFLSLAITLLAGFGAGTLFINHDSALGKASQKPPSRTLKSVNDAVDANAANMLKEGRQTFRYDTFGDEAFWGDTLKLHQGIAGVNFGGVGQGFSPTTALNLGLKFDVDNIPASIQDSIKNGHLDFNDPASTLALLRANSVIGLNGIFDGNTLKSVGLTCALCHSTVDDSLMPGFGHRLDGWANRDIDIGAIVMAAPNLQPMADSLGISVQTLVGTLVTWGPGKFDAEMFLDGKRFNAAQVTDGVVTARNINGATLIPNAYGLAGYNQHAWTGAWGTVTYWNALVANLEMHGTGRFFDPRLNDPGQFPLAAAHNLGDLPKINPDDDRITKTLPALHFYQLALPAPSPEPGKDFDAAAATRGDALFSGKAQCNNCHVEPLWTEPGWNLHTPDEIGIDSFEADRAPDHMYKTMNLAGIFVRENGKFMKTGNKGRYFHDGRFATLLDVVNHYNTHFSLGLTGQEKTDVVEYLKSLPSEK